MTNTPAITSIGIAVPSLRHRQSDIAEFMATMLQLDEKEKRRLRTLYKATGINYRHSVIEDYGKQPGNFSFFENCLTPNFPTTSKRMATYFQHAKPLALAAINHCLSQINHINQKDITHLITVSCTGMYAPGIDIEIIQALNLPASIQRTMINFMGCYAAFNALKVAHAICKANEKAKVLIVCVELCSLHFQKNTSIDSLLASAIFSDGAAAAIIEATTSAKISLQMEEFHCDLLLNNSKDMAWTIADHGFDMVLTSYVPQAIESGIANFIQRFQMQKNQFFDYYAIHPGGIKILKACEKALKISEIENRFAYEVMRNYGNMSSPTILFVLHQIFYQLEASDQGKTIFSCAFGPGLTLESMSAKICHA